MPITRSTFETSQRDEAAEYFTRAYKVSLRMDTSAEVLWRSRRIDTGRFAIDNISTPMDMHSEAVHDESMVIGELMAGRLEQSSKSFDERLSPGDVFLASLSPSLPYASDSHYMGLRLITVDTATMAEVLGVAPGERVLALRFSSIRAVSPGAAVVWKRTLDFAYALLDDVNQFVPPLMLDTFLRTFAALALVTFPNDIRVDKHYDGRDASPPAVRRAVAFIEANAHRDIALSDIVAAAHVGPRAVQLGFRRHLNTTPTGYLRRVRLAYAHDELKAADPDRGDTVSAIAHRWGFANLHRFERMYRDAYGRPPARNLHR